MELVVQMVAQVLAEHLVFLEWMERQEQAVLAVLQVQQEQVVHQVSQE